MILAKQGDRMVIGLSGENLEKLKAGIPINVPKLNLLVFYGGETDEEMMATFQQAGNIDKSTEIVDLRPKDT